MHAHLPELLPHLTPGCISDYAYWWGPCRLSSSLSVSCAAWRVSGPGQACRVQASPSSSSPTSPLFCQILVQDHLERLGVPTGFKDLDEITNGLHAGQMIIVAARPGVGKALALDTPLATPSGWTSPRPTRSGSSPGGWNRHAPSKVPHVRASNGDRRASQIVVRSTNKPTYINSLIRILRAVMLSFTMTA